MTEARRKMEALSLVLKRPALNRRTNVVGLRKWLE